MRLNKHLKILLLDGNIWYFGAGSHVNFDINFLKQYAYY